MPVVFESRNSPEFTQDLYRSVVQALVPLVILHSAERGIGMMYGRAVGKRLGTLGYRISSGRLYPLLRKMERDGLLSGRLCVVSGRTRRYYKLTRSGRFSLAQLRRSLSGLAAQIELNNQARAARDLVRKPQPASAAAGCLRPPSSRSR